MSTSGLRVAAVLLALAVLPGCEGGGLPMDPAVAAPHLPLAADGESLARPGGRPTLLTFGYTSCPDVCPATLSRWRDVRKRLGGLGDSVRFVFVSVDWRHDTPEVAAEFARRFEPRFIGVAPDSATLAAFMVPFKAQAAYSRSPGGMTETVQHTDYLYAIDGAGVIRFSYPFEAGAGAIAADLRRLVRRGRSAGPAEVPRPATDGAAPSAPDSTRPGSR